MPSGAFRLPVSGVPVRPREPDGHDEMVLAALSPDAPESRLEALRRLAPPAGDAAWEELPVADADAALLACRRAQLGDRVVAELACPRCGARGDLGFSIAGWLAAHAPRPVAGCARDAAGWWVLGAARLRAPRLGDLLAAASAPDADRGAMLERACVEAPDAPARARARRALARLAPLQGGAVQGACPECGEAIGAWFEPARFVLVELRRRALGVVEEVHAIAARYRWSEREILDLPRWRRARYAALIGGEGLAALPGG